MKKNILIILGIILFIVIFERIISFTSFFNELELMTYDIRAKIAVDAGPFGSKFKHADKNIVIVAIDDYSRKEIAQHPVLDENLGSFPWHRSVWGGVLDYIEQGQPKAVLFDLIFNGLNENTLNDRKFSHVLRKYDNVILATSLNDPKENVEKKQEVFLEKSSPKNFLMSLKNLFNSLSGKIPPKIDISGIQNSPYMPANKSLNVKFYDKKIEDSVTFYSHAPIPNLYTKYAMIGVVNKPTEEDSIIRTAQPLFKLIKGDEVYYMPSLAFAGFLKYTNLTASEIVVKNNEILLKNRKIPIDKNGQTNMSWHGWGNNYDYIPVSKILLSEDNENCGQEVIIDKTCVNPNYFKDKIVIIGRTEAGTDIHPSAVNPSFAGPEANATIMDNFINDSSVGVKGTRQFVVKMPKFNAFLLTVLCCFFIAFIGFISKNALICFLNSIGFIILYLLLCIWIFASPSVRVWVPVAIPVYYLIMTGALVFAYKFQQELAKKAMVMNTFGKFVSPKVLSTILKHQEDLVLKSTKKKITVMFCDIKNFTTLSEKCNPEQLVDNLNELFNELVNVVFDNNGTVDKFIGDCIMAYWGDPMASEDDAYMAVKTALEIKKKINELKIKNAKENKIIFDVKIGINTGDALLGLSGSNKIMSYTAMGDAVNVASRLESNCSKLERDILISKTTYEEVKDKIVVLEAGKISVKGRDEQIETYEPIGLAEENLEEIN